MRGIEVSDGWRPDDVADNAILDVGPVLFQCREGLPELDDRRLRVVHMLLELRQVRRRLLIALAACALTFLSKTVTVFVNVPTRARMDARRSSNALLPMRTTFLWSGCGGVVRIPLIFWKETEETNVQVL